MPPYKAVGRLEILCSQRFATHLFSVFTSWYKRRNDCCSTDQCCTDKSTAVPQQQPTEERDLTTEDWYIRHMRYGDECLGIDCGDGVPRHGALSPVPPLHDTVSTHTHHMASRVQQYVCHNLPPRFIEDMLATFITVLASKAEIPQPTKKLRLYEEDLEFVNSLGFVLSVSLKCLLVRGVTAVDLSKIAHLLKSWKLQCLDGKTVNKKGSRCETPYFDIFAYAFDESVSGLRTLKYLKLPHFVQNGFLRKVAYLCLKVEKLILRCSSDCGSPKILTPLVTNVEVLYGESVLCHDGKVRLVPGCKDLVTLVLPLGVEILDITDEVYEMLSYMPNLEYLVGVPMMYIIEEIGDMLLDRLPQLPKLRNFHHGAYGKFDWPAFVYEEYMQPPDPFDLSRLFSQVTEVCIYAPSQITEKVLQSFYKAQEVTLFTDDFEVHGKYLRNLSLLDINVGYQQEWPILAALSRTCPTLEQLTLHSFTLQLPYPRRATHPKPVFPHLHTLRLSGQNVLQQDALTLLLTGCPRLTTFVLCMITDERGDSQLDDSIMLAAVPYLANIQKFVYKVRSFLGSMDHIPSKLTMMSCEALIRSCPNLKYIGKLETWRVTEMEVLTLQEEVKKHNWDLKIV